MRASVVQGEDGAVEYQKVTLTPNTWYVPLSPLCQSPAPPKENHLRAWLAKQKASGRAPKETVQSLTIKVARLKKIQQLLEGAIEVTFGSLFSLFNDITILIASLFVDSIISRLGT